uniref:Putative receptor-like protein kinase At5g39030 n=1 Tax=Anthurium amnicola TaxID=1678845 RepID=A0A1D1ZAY3_9ARAE
MDDMTENFLSDYKNCMPTRYSYRQIKKMTRCFRDKLGQGGFGCVFRGKLLIGRPVAVKMLGNSKGNGRDFINEVATLGRIHHANVVQLLGFYAEGSKRALVYEFMPKGSLDKYIFPKDEASNSLLSWDKLLDIAVGIARGMEYLHRGCNMQILHFDIKPHNILLDENFNPKISDFGLAKLYPADDSKVSVTAVRGTIGYIAPELFYRKVGCVSSKSDVYSFGMLLMELAGKRRNVNVHVDQSSSQSYFPSWIYAQIEEGGDMGMADATHGERDIAKKMIIVALWCIQMRPVDRPTMSKVLEMLESDTHELQIPAKPFLSSPDHVTLEDITDWDDSSYASLGTVQYLSEPMTREDQVDVSSLV